MTFHQIVKLRNQLVAENDPSNAELITFYNRKLTEAIDKAYKKCLPNLKTNP